MYYLYISLFIETVFYVERAQSGALGAPGDFTKDFTKNFSKDPAIVRRI